MSTRSERLQSIRTRIAAIRAILEDPTTLTNVSLSGVSETVDRDQLRRELKELEREEEYYSGNINRLRPIDMRRA